MKNLYIKLDQNPNNDLLFSNLYLIINVFKLSSGSLTVDIVMNDNNIKGLPSPLFPLDKTSAINYNTLLENLEFCWLLGTNAVKFNAMFGTTNNFDVTFYRNDVQYMSFLFGVIDMNMNINMRNNNIKNLAPPIYLISNLSGAKRKWSGG